MKKKEYQKYDASKSTNLFSLLNNEYELFCYNYKINIESIKNYLIDDATYHLVFIDGIYNARLSNVTTHKDICCALSHALANKKYENIIENFYGRIETKDDYLNALNLTFAKDGAYIYIPTVVKKTIQILYIYTGKVIKVMLHPRNLIVLEKNSNVKIIEQHQCLNCHFGLSNSVTEIYTAENSKLEYCKLQNDSSNASLIDNTFVYQYCNSFCSINTFSFKGKLIRNNLNVSHNGEYIVSNLKWLTMLQEDELIDHTNIVDHKKPHCASQELYTCILNGNAKVWLNGKIIVHRNAQKTNAFQRNNNLLLSKEAFVATSPNLEIYADNVKCSHGCTVGNFNTSALFYLRSRGIPEKYAKAMLIFAFTREVLANINLPILKCKIHDMINKILDE